MQCSICHHESYDICHRDSGAPESEWILLFHLKYGRGFRLPVHLKFATNDWLKPFAASFSRFDSCHWSWNRSAGGTSYVAYQLTSSYMVMNNKQERQWNPTLAIHNKQQCQWNPTLAISDSRYNNSNIRTLIHFNIEERKIHLSSIVSLKNDLFDYLYQLRRLCVAWMSKEAYLDEASNTLTLTVHQTATCLHSLSASSYGPHEPPECGISLTSWC